MDLKIKNDIDNFWNKKNELNFSDPSIKKTIMQVLENLDSGSIRVCEKKKGIWRKDSGVTIQK